MNVNELTRDYMKLRQERERLSADFKSKDDVLKEAQEAVSAKILEICNDQNVNSIRTEHGTIIRSIKSQVHVLDWESFYEYILEHKALQLLHQRVHTTNFNQFISERLDEGLPPGVNVVREYDVSVRKPSSNLT